MPGGGPARTDCFLGWRGRDQAFGFPPFDMEEEAAAGGVGLKQTRKQKIVSLVREKQCEIAPVTKEQNQSVGPNNSSQSTTMDRHTPYKAISSNAGMIQATVGIQEVMLWWQHRPWVFLLGLRSFYAAA